MKEDQINTSHISSSYDESISEIQSKTLEMAGVVESSYLDALSGLIKADSELSHKVATNDFLANSLAVSYTHLRAHET